MKSNFRTRKIRPIVFLVAMVAILLQNSSSFADDWPRWMGPQGDGVWRETGILKKFPESGPKSIWSVEIGSGYSGPAIADGMVYVMDRKEDDGKGIEVENDIRKSGAVPGIERVLCFDAATGKEQWKISYECNYKIAYPTGPRCTPTIDGDHVYTLGAMGDLYCLNRKTGEEVWKKQLMEEYECKPPLWGFSSHPFVDGNNLIVPVGGAGSGLVAFDKKTGKEIWKSVTTFDIAYAPITIYEKDDERQLIFWHAEGIDALDPETGKKFWNVQFPEKRNQSQVQIATPQIVGNKILISEYYKGSLLLEVGSNPPSVKELWRSQTTDPRNREALNCMMTTPFVRNGLAYGIAYNQRGAGVFRCIELETGKHLWTDEKWLGEKPLMFAAAFIIENDGRYFIFNDIGELMIANITKDGFKEIDRAKILEATGAARGRKVVWSHPAFSNGHMIARNDKEIVCIDLRAEKASPK